MKTEEQIFYKKVYIHSEKDLPKESKLLFFYNEIKHEGFDIAVNLLDKGCMSNLLTFEWYLLPVTLPSNKEIERETPAYCGLADEAKAFQAGATWLKSRLTDKSKDK